MKLIVLNTVFILLWCGALSDSLRELIYLLFSTHKKPGVRGDAMDKSQSRFKMYLQTRLVLPLLMKKSKGSILS